jgi:hypothetical protein
MSLGIDPIWEVGITDLPIRNYDFRRFAESFKELITDVSIEDERQYLGYHLEYISSWEFEPFSLISKILWENSTEISKDFWTQSGWLFYTI